MSWQEAGAAWGARAADWATLQEPWFVPVYCQVFEALEVGGGDRLLDVACGSGLALTVAASRGAKPAGLDAAGQLVRIARDRLPDADIRTGDMQELPWDDDSFDCVTSFNGVWAGGAAALAEIRRVLRPGGRVGVSFWGNPKRMDVVASWGQALAELQPPDEFEAGTGLLEIGRPGVAEAMLEAAGITPGKRETVVTVTDFPDLEGAVRAMSAGGPAWAAIEHSGWDAWADRLRELFAPYVAEAGVIRLRNEWAYLVGGG